MKLKALIFFILFSQSIFAQETEGIDLWGMTITGVEVSSDILMINNGVADSAPSPIVNTIGLSLPVGLGDLWTFRPGASLFWNVYGFQDGRAVPLETDFDSVLMLSLLIDPAFGLGWSLAPDLIVGLESGPTLLYRIPIFFLGEGGSQALDVTGWFLAGRFIYWKASSHLAWKFSELFSLTLRIQGQFPVYALWDELPFGDQILWGFGLGLRFNLGIFDTEEVPNPQGSEDLDDQIGSEEIPETDAESEADLLETESEVPTEPEPTEGA